MWIKKIYGVIIRHFLMVFILILSSQASIAKENFSELFGLWHWETTEIEVNVEKCSYNPNKICAVVAKGKNKGNFVLRSILRQNEKIIGEMIHPINGRSYSAEIKLLNKNQVEISGCVPGSKTCQKSTWSRIEK